MAYRSKPEYISSVLGKSEIKELIQMKKMGYSNIEIAKYFDVHRNTVANILKRAAQSPDFDYRPNND